MIVREQKPIAEIKEIIFPYKKLLILGGGKKFCQKKNKFYDKETKQREA